MASQHMTRKETATGACVHHWMVEPAGGPTSGARCRRCGEERSFFNNPDAVTDTDARTKSGFGHSSEHHRQPANNNSKR